MLCHSGELDKAFIVDKKYFDICGPDTYSKEAQQGLYYDIESMYGKGNMIPLHECGTLPSPEECKQNGTQWLWWMLWHTQHVQQHDKAELRRIYNHPDVITLDELQSAK